MTPPSIPTRAASDPLLGDIRRPHPLPGPVPYDADRGPETASTTDVKTSSTPSHEILSLGRGALSTRPIAATERAELFPRSRESPVCCCRA